MPRKGEKNTPDAIAKNRAAHMGSKNGVWQGDSASYRALHSRVVTRRGKASDHPCMDCGDTARRHEWANKTGKYSDTNDYDPVCVPCHKIRDKDKT